MSNEYDVFYEECVNLFDLDKKNYKISPMRIVAMIAVLNELGYEFYNSPKDRNNPPKQYKKTTILAEKLKSLEKAWKEKKYG